MTTYEKLNHLVAALARVDPRTLAPEFGDLIEGFQIVRGLTGGRIPNPLTLVLPTDPADADLLVDKGLALLYALRGDDLPPFDPGRYGEGAVAELIEALTGDVEA